MWGAKAGLCGPIRRATVAQIAQEVNAGSDGKTIEQWKKVAWSDESHFLLHHVDGWVRLRRLPVEHMAPGCTMGRRQAGGGSVMLWAMFCWETLHLHLHLVIGRRFYPKRLTIGEYIKRFILKRQSDRGSARNTKSQSLFK